MRRRSEMTAIETLLRQPAAQAVGWALLQFVWQGAAVGALTGLALLALGRSASDVRYVVAAVGLALMLTLPAVSGVQKFQALRVGAAAGALVPSAAFTGATGQSRETLASTREASGAAGGTTGSRATGSPGCRVLPAAPIEPLLPTLVLVWIAGGSMLSPRLPTGWICVQPLRTRGHAAAPDDLQP